VGSLQFVHVFVRLARVLLVVALGARSVLAGNLQIGDLGAFLLLTSLLYQPAGKLHELNQLVQAGRAAGERVFEILDSVGEPKSGQTFDRKVQGEIEFRHVSFSYSDELPAVNRHFISRAARRDDRACRHHRSGKVNAH